MTLTLPVTCKEFCFKSFCSETSFICPTLCQRHFSNFLRLVSPSRRLLFLESLLQRLNLSGRHLLPQKWILQCRSKCSTDQWTHPHNPQVSYTFLANFVTVCNC